MQAIISIKSDRLLQGETLQDVYPFQLSCREGCLTAVTSRTQTSLLPVVSLSHTTDKGYRLVPASDFSPNSRSPSTALSGTFPSQTPINPNGRAVSLTNYATPTTCPSVRIQCTRGFGRCIFAAFSKYPDRFRHPFLELLEPSKADLACIGIYPWWC